MVRAVVTGAAGRMGTTLVRLIGETEGIEVAAAVERPAHPAVGRDAGEVAGIGPLGVRIGDDLETALADAGVVVDFTSATASVGHVDAVCRAGKAIVVGSTGFSPEDRRRLEERADEARIFLAPNMSIGVNVLLKVVGEVARALGDGYDVEIVETHHRFKKDSPSGTALALAEAVAAALGRDLESDAVYGRHGLGEGRPPRQIGIHAVRAGDVVGDHTVVFGGLGERVEITHRATSRETFARGAIRAALWLVNQPNGFYGMADLLASSNA
ncbi:4-hydroxy-tetrahydrodipicolinate reductase [Deferrisoma palaeochoriense]